MLSTEELYLKLAQALMMRLAGLVEGLLDCITGNVERNSVSPENLDKVFEAHDGLLPEGYIKICRKSSDVGRKAFIVQLFNCSTMATDIDLVKMSSKGQLVVPQDIREELGWSPGERFAVFPVKEGILIKRIDVEQRLADFEALAKRIETTLRKNKVNKKDIEDAVKWARRKL